MDARHEQALLRRAADSEAKTSEDLRSRSGALSASHRGEAAQRRSE